MLLLIDNYDSFTYNLYQYLSELGADVQVRRNDRVTFAEIAGPSRTLTVRFSSRKPACVTVNSYLAGAKKKNLYTPSRSVFVDWVVSLALSRITTSASGRRAFVGSVTTPLRLPEVVVCVYSLRCKRTKRTKNDNVRRDGNETISTTADSTLNYAKSAEPHNIPYRPIVHAYTAEPFSKNIPRSRGSKAITLFLFMNDCAVAEGRIPHLSPMLIVL